MENNIKKVSDLGFEHKKPIIYIQYIISNCHIEIKYSLPKNLSDKHPYTFQEVIFEYIKNKFEKSFKDEKQIWEDYKYIHNKEMEVTKEDQTDFYKISMDLDLHFNSIYEDAKKVYERRNEG
jgi:hypothetical protein